MSEKSGNWSTFKHKIHCSFLIHTQQICELHDVGWQKVFVTKNIEDGKWTIKILKMYD